MAASPAKKRSSAAAPSPVVAETEATFLGAALLAPTRDQPEIAGLLAHRDDLFARPVHQRVAEALVALASQGDAWSPATVATWLAGAGKTAGISLAWLHGLTSTAVSGATWRHHYSVIADIAVRRATVEACRDILDAALQPPADLSTAEVVTAFETAAWNIRTQQSAGLDRRANRIEDLVDTWLGDLDTRQHHLRTNPDALTGIPTGLHILDSVLSGFQRQTLTLVAARPSVGKTTLLCQTAAAAANENTPVLFASLEMRESELLDRIIATQSGVAMGRIRGGVLSTQERHRVTVAALEVQRWPLHIVCPDGNDANTTPGIRALANRTRPGLVIVDFVQLIQPTTTQRRNANTAEELGEITRDLKALARELNTAVVAACQLNREGAATRTTGPRPPVLSDLASSGALEATADVVIALHSPTTGTGTRDLLLLKHRQGPAGGTHKLALDGATQRFTETNATVNSDTPTGHH